MIESTFSSFLEKFEKCEDKEDLLKQLFVELFTDCNFEDKALMPHLSSVADDYLTLLFKFIWSKLRTPDIKNFGKRFFLEIADYQY